MLARARTSRLLFTLILELSGLECLDAAYVDLSQK